MKVKICGITSFEDAMIAIDAGADALGFVFYEKSSRYVEPKKAKEIISQLPPFVEKVALFVNEDSATINRISKESGATLAQLHFEVTDSLITELDIPYIRVIRAQSREDITKYSDTYRLVDAYCESYGGMGKRINIEWFENIDCSKVILAGGLNAQNVAAVKKYGFYGVDVSSGVEISQGKKEPHKVKDFIDNAQ